MRLLGFLEPLVMHSRPFHYWRWLDHWSQMWAGLRQTNPAHEMRLITNHALAKRALAPIDRDERAKSGARFRPQELVVLEQEAIRRIFGVPNVDILVGLHRGQFSAAQVEAYAAYIVARLDGFEPDVILSLSPVPFLRAAFPRALLLSNETGAFSRAPYELTMFFDPGGMWDQSVLARCAEELFDRSPPQDEREFLAAFRDHFRPHLEGATPFAELERDLRSRYRRLALLPLQFGGEAGFDANGPFRNQGEYLFHVLEELPEGVALIAVEHPTAHWIGDIIDAETRDYLAEAYPQLTFVDFRMFENAGQLLIQHVDYVIALSTSLGLQAMFWGKPLVSVQNAYLRVFASVHGVHAIPTDAQPKSRHGVDDALAWMLTHYFVPGRLAGDGQYMEAFLERSLARSRQNDLGLGFFSRIASNEVLRDVLCPSRELPRRLEVKLHNGGFVLWSSGPGPFGSMKETTDGWHLVDFAGGNAKVSRQPLDLPLSGGAKPHEQTWAVRIERSRGVPGLTLFLQRVPDVDQLAGALGRLGFWARSATSSPLLCYFYQQFQNGEAGCGTDGRTYRLTPEWRRYVYTAEMPRSADRSRGPGHHTEIVFAIPAEEGAAMFELAEVTLGPG
jgi:hypothetical protein